MKRRCKDVEVAIARNNEIIARQVQEIVRGCGLSSLDIINPQVQDRLRWMIL